MRAVITVIGKDTVGILAKVSAICAEYNANIIDVTQTVMQDLFAMIMLAQIDKMKTDFNRQHISIKQFNWSATDILKKKVVIKLRIYFAFTFLKIQIPFIVMDCNCFITIK